MATVMKMPLADGSTVLVEVAGDEQRLERVGRGRTVVQEGAQTLEDALSQVKPAIAAVFHQVRTLATPPEKVTLEFGVKLTAEAGAVIAKAAAEANFTLSLEWTTTTGSQDGSQSSAHGEAGGGRENVPCHQGTLHDG